MRKEGDQEKKIKELEAKLKELEAKSKKADDEEKEWWYVSIGFLLLVLLFLYFTN